MKGFASHTLIAFRRQVQEAARNPAPFYVLPLLPPLLMTVVFAALFDRIDQAPGYDGGDYVTYLVPGVVVLVALLGGGATSSGLAADLRSGYFDRVRLLPIRPASQIVGRLLFEAVRLIPATVLVLVAGFALGARSANGLSGVIVVAALISFLGVAHSGLFYSVAIRTRDPQTPMTLQPLGLPLAFLSSALVPLVVMPGWAERLAQFNPVTIVVDGARESMLGQLWSRELLEAVAVLALWTLLSELVAGRMLAAHVRRR